MCGVDGACCIDEVKKEFCLDNEYANAYILYISIYEYDMYDVGSKSDDGKSWPSGGKDSGCVDDVYCVDEIKILNLAAILAEKPGAVGAK